MTKKKYFIITVDTEGDNLWGAHHGEPITTRNTAYIPRFQMLCNEYGFKPVYLTNYEMACDDEFVSEARQWMLAGKCEIGLHVHGWNNPPFYQLEGDKYAHAYLYEYPENIIKEKVLVTQEIIHKKFGVKPISHRAGKWAMNEVYFRVLKEIGIKVDCSYCPGVNWSSTIGATRGGTDYSKSPHHPQWINNILEVPMTIRVSRWKGWQKLKRILKTFYFGYPIWLRPASSSLKQMIQLVNYAEIFYRQDYLMFMVHSSELMPGGSPYFTNEEAIENEYKTMRLLFEYVTKKGYVGCTLKEYYNEKSKSNTAD